MSRSFIRMKKVLGPSPGGRSNLECMDQGIDAVARQYQAVVDLKIERNKLAPISKLPPDILYNIFFIASRDFSTYGPLAQRLEWIKLTYVCHDWRNLALASPCLWSAPPFDSPRWAKEMLIRSKTANLTINADASIFTNHEKRHTLFNVFHTHMPRIKSVHISLHSKTTSLFQYLLGSAPNLESLELDIDRSKFQRVSHLEVASFVPVNLPPDSLSGMVHLRRMDMSGIGIDWDVHLPTGSSLTSLRLNDIHASFRPTMAQVWDALERMPLLEMLELKAALPPLKAPTTSNRTIRFDRLQKMSIETGIAVMESFLQTIIVPSTVEFNVHCVRDSPTGYVNVDKIISSFQQSTKSSMSKHECLDFHYSPENHNARSGIDFIVSSEHDRGSKRYVPPVCFEVIWSHGEGSQDEYLLLDAPIKEPILLSVCQHISLDSVKDVYLAGPIDDFSVPALLQTIGSMPHVQYLNLELGPAILCALQSNLHDDSENIHPPPVSFPSLRSLTISDTFFHYETRRLRGKIRVRLQDFIDCLIWRKEHGVPVLYLNFLECNNIYKSDIDCLKNLAEVVNWDGCTSLYSGSDEEEDEEEEEYYY